MWFIYKSKLYLSLGFYDSHVIITPHFLIKSFKFRKKLQKLFFFHCRVHEAIALVIASKQRDFSV